MKRDVLLLSRDSKLADQVSAELQTDYRVAQLGCLDEVPEKLRTTPITALLLHYDEAVLDGETPDEFSQRLKAVVGDTTVFALMPENSSSQQRHEVAQWARACFSSPWSPGALQQALLDRESLLDSVDGFWQHLPHRELRRGQHSIVTFTPEMFRIMDGLEVAARHEVTVLLIGETGSGKSYMAHLLHELSSRSSERFCTVACGSLPPNLLESELFGYVKGAFTGAETNKEGKFDVAGQGTLLLDEIDVLPLEQQAKLLRVIETGEYEAVGSNEVKYVQARLIVASNYELEDLVNAGTFRQDLYYRLNVLGFHLPALRQRPWDIEYLVRKFSVQQSRAHGVPLTRISPQFMQVMRSYSWPGNIRELENVVQRAVLYCSNETLMVDNLPQSVLRDFERSKDIRRPGRKVQGAAGERHSGRPDSPYRTTGKERSAPMDEWLLDMKQPATLESRLVMLEQRVIEDSLRRNNQRRKNTAAELGISRVTLYNKMKKFGMLS